MCLGIKLDVNNSNDLNELTEKLDLKLTLSKVLS